MIAERPSVETSGPRRDEVVDIHPRPRNNAGTGVSTPESEFSFSRSARIPNPNFPVSAIIFGNQYMDPDPAIGGSRRHRHILVKRPRAVTHNKPRQNTGSGQPGQIHGHQPASNACHTAKGREGKQRIQSTHHGKEYSRIRYQVPCLQMGLAFGTL